MSDPGLNQRLRQRSRRSGLMIGLSMALTLVVCVIAFTMIYAQLEPVVSDFVGRGDIEVPTPVPTVVAEAPQPTAPPAVDPAATEEPADAEAEATVAPTEEPEEEGFTPNYQISADGPVNLRPGPGVGSGDAIIALPVGTPLMYMDEEIPTEDPGRDDLSEGSMWLRFQTEDGTEGWIREVDVSEYVP